MDETKDKINEIIRLIKAKDSLYKDKASDLLESLKDLERKMETADTQLTAILLNFILENYTLSNLTFNLISKESMTAIEKLLQKIYEGFLPNVYDLFDSIKTGKEKVNPLVLDACKNIYKQKQINFIRQFYSRISMKNLREFFPINEIDNIISQEGWIKEKDCVIPTEKSAPPEFNVGKEVEDIKYINDMNVQFNKLIKEHAHLVTFQNNKQMQ
jgi:hypothetical protein